MSDVRLRSDLRGAPPGRSVPDLDPPVSFEAVGVLLQGLDGPQRRAVTHGEGPLLVVAGPGTGKTRVVSHRIAWLVATRRARPSEILGLTFTDRAADEMQERVDRLVPYGYNDTAVHTFHAFGDGLVREHAFRLGLPDEPRLLARAEAVIFLRDHLFELGLERFRPLGDPTRFLEALVALFGRAKEEDVWPSDYRAHADRLAARAAAASSAAADDGSRDAAAALTELAANQTELATAYERYQTLMGAAGAIDFGDQIALAVRLLREARDVRTALQRRFRYVLVDEFQDTDPAQLELIRLLIGSRRNVTAVGDDDQAIYTFRGAALGNVLGFAERFGGARTIVLRRNHRSRAPILEAAHRLIRHNDPARLEVRAGLDKRLVAARRRARPNPVLARAFLTVEQEAEWVAAEVARRIRGGRSLRDVAILVRANADAAPFLRALDGVGLRWRFSGASGLYARREVRELLAFVRVVADLESTVDLYAVATGEPYGLGGADLTCLLDAARRRHRSLWQVLCDLDEQPRAYRVSPATRRAAHRLLVDLRAASELAHRRTATEVLYDHLKRSGRLARLAAAGPEAEDELENVARFFRVVQRQASLLVDGRIPFVARHLQALVEAGDDPASSEADEEQEGVAVLTVHKAKGLEFPIVFVAGLADGRFPARGRRQPLTLPDELRRSGRLPGREELLDEVALAEERRLAYVAMTRARDELILTFAASTGGRRRRRPSPFIAEALDRPAPMAPAAEVLALELPRPTPVEPGPVALTPALPSGPLELSYSQLESYLTCPLQYKLRHRLGVPAPAHHALVYGSALHAAVAAYHASEQRGTPLGEEALLKAFAAHWSPEGFLSQEHEAARFAAGQATLRSFRAARLAEGGPAPTGVEQPFSFALEGDRIRGRFDRLDTTPEGALITDYKTSDVRDPLAARARARASLQLAIYALAHEATSGRPPVAVQLHFLDSGVVGRVPVEPARLDAARRTIRAAAQGIRDGQFEATPDRMACGFCPFREICPRSLAR